MPRILLTHPLHPEAGAAMAGLGEPVIAPDTSPDTLRRLAAGCAVVVVRAPLPDDIFDAAPSLIGAVRHGAGVDMIPLEQASAHGVLVANLLGVNANAVAEHVVRSMLLMARRVPEISTLLRPRTAAAWASARAVAEESFELPGRTVGVVGFGHVGQAIGRLCVDGFSMKLLAHTRSAPGDAAGCIAARVSLDELLARSDFVVLACPLTGETRGLIGAARLARMRRGAMLINVARGPVVHEAAVLDALRSGQLAAAALDVFETQPLAPDHPFWTMPQVLLTPHVAGITCDSMRAMGLGAARAVAALLAGRVPAHCVNPQATTAFLQRMATRRGMP